MQRRLLIALAVLVVGGCTSTTNVATSTSSGSGSGSGSTTGSTTGSSSTSSSGSTTGASDCAPDSTDGGLAPLNACTNDLDCACPARCVLDPGLSPYLLKPFQKECELPCQTNADCPNPSQRCANGSCGPNLCNEPLPDGGAIDAPAWGPCDVAGTGDGTCIDTQTAVLSSDQNTLLSPYLCFAPGTSDGGCVPGAERSRPQDSCALGLFCERAGVISGLDAGACRRGCIPGTADACDADEGCGLDHICHTVGAGGCLEGFVYEDIDCAVDSDCGCPHHCRADPGLGINRCVDSCATSADCSLDDDHCAGGLCLVNFCSADLLGNPAPGAYANPCDAFDGGDGTCLAVGYEGAGFPAEFEFGVCVRGGTASQNCGSPLGNQAGGVVSFALVSVAQEIGVALDAASLCPTGELCAYSDGGSSACTAICDPLDGGVSCASGSCIEQGGDPVVDMGACLACVQSGAGCALDSDCCSKHCAGESTCG